MPEMLQDCMYSDTFIFPLLVCVCTFFGCALSWCACVSECMCVSGCLWAASFGSVLFCRGAGCMFASVVLALWGRVTWGLRIGLWVDGWGVLGIGVRFIPLTRPPCPPFYFVFSDFPAVLLLFCRLVGFLFASRFRPLFRFVELWGRVAGDLVSWVGGWWCLGGGPGCAWCSFWSPSPSPLFCWSF